MDETNRLECIDIIVDRCFAKNNFKDYSMLLSVNDCISKDQRKEIQKLEKEEGSFIAVTHAHKHAKISDIISALGDKDFDVDKKIIDVIEKLETEKEFSTETYWVIRSWDDLVLLRADLIPVVGKLWPEYDCTNVWPLHFLHFLLTSEEGRVKIKTFVQEANNVILQKKNTRMVESSQTSAQKKLRTGDGFSQVGMIADASNPSYNPSFFEFEASGENQNNGSVMEKRFEVDFGVAPLTPMIQEILPEQPSVSNILENPTAIQEEVVSGYFEHSPPSFFDTNTPAESLKTVPKPIAAGQVQLQEHHHLTTQLPVLQQQAQNAGAQETKGATDEITGPTITRKGSGTVVSDNENGSEESTNIWDHTDKFEQNPDVFKPIVKLAWPQEASSILNNEWPWGLLEKVEKMEKLDVKKNIEEAFLLMVKCVDSSQKVEIKDEVRGIKWIRKNVNTLSKYKKEMKILLKVAWPEDTKMLTENWLHELNKKKTSHDMEIMKNFTDAAKIILSNLKKESNEDGHKAPNESKDSNTGIFKSLKNLKKHIPGQDKKNTKDKKPENTGDEEFQVPASDFHQNIIEPKISLKSNECIEFRVVLDNLESDYGTLCMVENCWQDWAPIRMQRNSHGYYFTQIPVPEEKREMEYKYVLSNTKGNCAYEILPTSWNKSANRVILMEKGGVVIHDLPIFEMSASREFERVAHIKAWQHLPEPSQIPLPSEEKTRRYSLDEEVYNWLNSMKNGYRTTGVQPLMFISQEAINCSITRWLTEVQFLGDDERNVFKLVLCGLSALISYNKLKASLLNKNLVSMLFESISMHSLDLTQQKKLYVEINLAWRLGKGCQSICLAICDAFKMLENFPMVEWILALPTYWLIYNEGEVKEKPKQYPVSGDKWKIDCEAYFPGSLQLFRKDAKYLRLQSTLTARSKEVFEMSAIHPWIVGTYISVLTPRTLGRILKLHEKHKIADRFPLDLIMHVLLSEWGLKTDKSDPLESIHSAKQYLEERFEIFLKKGSEILSEEQLKEQLSSSHRILSEIVQVVTDMADFPVSNANNADMIWFLKMASYSATKAKNIVILLKESYEETRSYLSIFVNAGKNIIEANLRKHNTCFEFVDAIFNISWLDEKFDAIWKDYLKDLVGQLLPKVWPKESGEFLKFYGENMPKLQISHVLYNLLDNYAYKCCEDFLENSHPRNRNRSTRENPDEIIKTKISKMLEEMRSPLLANKFGEVFVKKFDAWHSTQSSSSAEEYSNSIDFLASWPYGIPMFKHFYNSTTKKKSETWKPGGIDECIRIILRNIKEAIRLFKTGNLQISMMEIFIKNSASILDIDSVVNKPIASDGQTSSVDGTLKYYISRCEKQLEAAVCTRKFIVDFMELCVLLKTGGVEVDMESLGSVIHKPSSLLSTVINLNEIPESPEQGIYSYRELGKDNIQKLCKISSIKDSKVFQKMWIDGSQEMFAGDNDNDMNDENNFIVSWKDVLKKLWNKVQQTLHDAFSNIEKGSVTVRQAIEWFYFAVDTDKPLAAVSKEMNRIRLASEVPSDNAEKLRTKSKKINNILEVKLIEKFADSILKAKNVLNLTNSFHELENIQRLDDNMDDCISQLHLDQQFVFRNLKSNTVDVLEAFLFQQELFLWLKVNMQDRAGVKVFCDLGMISAGESAYEVDKVSCLLSAVVGFAPLIFDVREDITLNDFVKLCEEISANYAKNKKLIENWNDTGGRLEWFEMIRNLHGSVENQSLMQVTEINMYGTYVIKKPSKGNAVMNNCIQLIVLGAMSKEGKEERKEKIFSLSDLYDLQSKLMLIAGESDKGQEDVARFNEVLMAVETFTKAFVDLLTSGCMLFNDFNAKFVNRSKEQDDAEEMLMVISFMEDVPPLSQSAKIKDIESIAQVLIHAHEEWLSQMDGLRDSYYYLNDFTQNQIIYLCEQLMQDHLPDQVFTLLNCHSFNAITRAFNAAERNNDLDEENFIDDNAQPEMGESTDFIQEKQKLVHEIVSGNEDVSISNTQAAVQALGLCDEQDILSWILDHENDPELIAKLCEDFKQEQGFAYAEKNVAIYPQLLQDRKSFTLEEILLRVSNSTEVLNPERVIKTIYGEYFRSQSKLSLGKFLSIKHLGKFLDELKKDIAIGQQICHKLFDPLKCGQPNLVVCPSNEMLHKILSLYMYNQDAPLPSTSEVLLCSNNTSADETERFLRRAMCSSSSKAQLTYCMAFADYLEDTVSSHMLNVYENLSKSATLDQKYQLVFFVSKQKHHIISYFDKYQVEMKSHLDKDKISQYLTSKLSSSDNDSESSVKIVTSQRSGVGKSLYIRRQMENHVKNYTKIIVRLLQKQISIDHVIEILSNTHVDNNAKHFIHIDLTPVVLNDVDLLMFNLFVLGSITNSNGKMWRRYPQHKYFIEMTMSIANSAKIADYPILSLVPEIKCISPIEAYNTYESGNLSSEIVLMDNVEFRSNVFQRPYQYLKLYYLNKSLDKFEYSGEVKGNEAECIEILVRYCGISDPSWAQLRHFASFLNLQLEHCETSEFCRISIASRTFDVQFRGLKSLAIRFMIIMAQDLSTPSLSLSDQSIQDVKDNQKFSSHQIRRKWEERNHPFIFFNKDHQTMTFMNVKCAKNGNILDENGQQIPDTAELANELKMQGVLLNVDYNLLKREEKLTILCQFMGIPKIFDPDPTYELTTDNTLKMFAISMRLRCDIPVIVMGETGCGKTRMIEFMSKLKAGGNADVRNMITLKVHGGIKASHIYECVRESRDLAVNNEKVLGSKDYDASTILFFDEANTTEAIYAIKEVVCDFSIEGDSFCELNLKIIAACNPYKRLSPDAIKKLEESGLGYCVKDAKDTEMIGNVSMRTLVYRVVSLPPSMQPFVWDFGQLTDDTEKIYVGQMISHLGKKMKLKKKDQDMIQQIICAAQRQIRKSVKDECRYVSLRDVERSILTLEWFYNNKDNIFRRIDVPTNQGSRSSKISVLGQCLLQTLNVCYHASLNDRLGFRGAISTELKKWDIFLSPSAINELFIACQTAFFNDLRLPDNIACNEALRENVFLMIVCAELRIPLFVVGKPGSSKSLAKTIVGDNMQGRMSSSPLCKQFKQVHMLSYQCSALTDANGIESIFKQCTQLQAKQNLDEYVAVVVLDEIGLAEDSANMPLKILHPLLECGSTQNSSLTGIDPKMKVGFIGISNWSLDPAKMNRGIFITRTKVKRNDLEETAKGIFSNMANKLNEHATVLKLLTKLYLEIYKGQEKEYFGLRDYYGLIKMIYSKCVQQKTTNGSLTRRDVEEVVSRNFGGGQTDYHEIFKKILKQFYPKFLGCRISIEDMLAQNLKEESSRFLLILTNQVSSVDLLKLALKNYEKKFCIVYGSSFPNDVTYTERCRNINRIKICMESGRTVVLLNLTSIHESLYDVLNQQYVSLSKQRYVDLGLGGHRVKCRIAHDFRLIVLEQKDIVYKKYPIPLINRLEKHHLTAESMLTPTQRKTAQKVNKWVQKYSHNESNFSSSDCFLGFHDDTVGSILLSGNRNEKECHHVLLNSATVDSVFRLSKSKLQGEYSDLQNIYLKEQLHDNLWDLLLHVKNSVNESMIKVLEIPSYSDILSGKDRKDIETHLNLPLSHVMLLSLQHYKTEQEYHKNLISFFEQALHIDEELDTQNAVVLLIQCPKAHKHVQLIACARYGIMNVMPSFLAGRKHKPVIIAFLLATERNALQDHNDSSSGNQLSTILQPNSDTEIVFVDDFKPSLKRVKITNDLLQLNIVQLLTAEKDFCKSWKQENNYKNVYIPTLLNDCIWEAMSKLKDEQNNDSRLFQRIEILTDMFSGEIECSDSFLNIFVSKLIKILEQKNKHNLEDGSWHLTEACSLQKLQDGGTFGKTLWLGLKRQISILVAYITSLLDEDCNLNMIASEEYKQMHDIWLQLFDALEVSWDDVIGKMDFRVSNRQLYYCHDMQIPFISTIHRYLDDQWKAADGNRKIFFNLVRTSQPKVAHAIACTWELFKPMDIFRPYALDLTYLCYKGRNDIKDTEANFLTTVLCDFAFKELQNLRETSEFENRDVFSIIFYISKKFSKHLEMILQVLNIDGTFAKNFPVWIESQQKAKQFIVHELVLEAAVKFLNNETSFKDEKGCKIWMNKAGKLKFILHSALDLIENEEKKKEIIKMWQNLSVLDLLLLHLLPDSSNDDVFERYMKVVSGRAKMLYKGLGKGIRNQNFLRRLLTVLKTYSTEVKSKVRIDWLDEKCVICKEEKCKDFQVLSCGHFAGRNCISIVLNDQCPICMHNIHAISDIVLTTDKEREISSFLANCTSFFLEFLSQFCFPKKQLMVGSEVIADDDIRLLLEYLVFDCQKTGNFSLDTSGLHINIFSQSAILSMAVQNHYDVVERALKDWIVSYKEKNHATMNAVLKSLEQKFFKSSSLLTFNKPYESCEKILRKVREKFADALESPNPKIATLNIVSNIRYCLSLVASFVQNPEFLDEDVVDIDEEYDNPIPFLYIAKNLCKDDKSEMLKEYLVKIGCHKYGMEWFNRLTESKDFEEFIPSNLKKVASEQHIIDYWSLLGREYLEMRSILNKNAPSTCETFLPECFSSGLGKCDIISKVLAIVAFLDEHPQHTEQFKQNIKKANAVTLFDYLGNVYRNVRTSLTRYNLSKQLSVTLLNLLTYTAGVLVFDSSMMKEFTFFITRLDDLRPLFWPAMPQSQYFSLPADILAMNGKEVYVCPNGHLYLIGNCARPTTTGRCTDCNAWIGGRNYREAPGNFQFTPTKKSQAGYKLLKKEPNTDDPAERMTKQGVAVIHFLIHCGMFISTQYSPVNEEKITLLLQQTSPDFAKDYLVEKIIQNLHELSSALGRNMDAVVPVVFRILQNILGASNGTDYDGNWGSMESRRVWEQKFHKKYLLPVFENINDILIEAQNDINDAEDLRSLALYRIVYEIQDNRQTANQPNETALQTREGSLLSTATPPQSKFWTTPSLWSLIEQPSSAHLLNYIRNCREAKAGQILQTILEMPNLDCLQHLKMILDIQKIFIDRYQNKVDLTEADKIPLEKAIEDGCTSEENVQKYISLWNAKFGQLRSSCTDFKNEWLEDISLASPVSVVLPSTRGRGKCAKYLSEHLIHLHNTFLERCKQAIQQNDSITEIEVSQLLPSHFIEINPEKDFLPLIQLHSSYEIKTDKTGRRHHIISYNIDALEKQAKELYCMYKKLVNVKSLPCIEYPQDTGIGSDWQEVIRNTEKQFPLTPNIVRELDGAISESSLSEICEAVRILTQSIGFLSKVKCDSSRSLLEYLRQDLLHDAQTKLIPSATKVHHTLALYQYLTWKKSVNFVQMGIDPYQEALHGVEQEAIPGPSVNKLIEAFEKMNVCVLQQQINELLIQVNDFEYWANYSYVEDILPDQKFLGNEEGVESRFEKMPEDICFKHTSHLFKLTVEFTK